MDLVVKTAGTRVSDQIRRRLERKLTKLERHGQRVRRAEVRVIKEPNPRVNGGHRVEASCWAARRRFHASGAGSNVEAAIDQVIQRLERQLSDHEGKRRAKVIEGANRVKSGRIHTQEDSSPSEEGEGESRG